MLPGLVQRHSNVAFFCTANTPILSIKGICKDAFFDSKEREDDTMTHTIRGPPTGKAPM